MDDSAITIEASLWRWVPTPPTKGSWHFVTITGEAADHVRVRAFERRAAGQKSGFGSVPVEAQIGGSIFTTSLFPHRESGGYILPVKATVRRAEDIGEGDMVRLTLRL